MWTVSQMKTLPADQPAEDVAAENAEIEESDETEHKSPVPYAVGGIAAIAVVTGIATAIKKKSK